MERKQKDKRRLLWVLPILLLPFMALAFYALGGGKGEMLTNQNAVKGLNTELPDAQFKRDAKQDKLSLYEQVKKDSAKVKDNALSDLANRLGFHESIGTSGNRNDSNEQQINEKLAQIHREINRPEPVKAPVKTMPDYGASDEVKRLEQLMQTMQGGNTEEDPEMKQLSEMLERILDIQHPERVQAKLRQQDVVLPQTLYEAIPAIIVDKQKVTEGSAIKLCLMDSVWLNGVLIPKNHLVYGTCKIQNQRLMLDIRNIRLGNSILPVNLTVFDLDGMVGINVPEALTREAVNSGTGDAISGLQLMTLDSSPTAQITGAGIQAAKGLLRKKVKRIKVKLQSGYPVLLRDNNHR